MLSYGKVPNSAIVIAMLALIAGVVFGYPVPKLVVSLDEHQAVASERDSLAAQTKSVNVTFRLDWYAGGEDSAWMLGVDKGFFRNEGINLEIISGSGSMDSLRLLAMKAVDFAICDSFVVVQGVAREMPIKTIVIEFTHSPITILSLAEKNITKPEDLIGKKVAVSKKSTTFLALRAFLKLNNLSSEDMQIVDYGFSLQPLLVGQVDAVLEYTMDGPVKATDLGYKVNEIMLSDYGIDVYGATIICHTDTLKNNPDLVRRFLRATIRSRKYTVRHPDEAIDALIGMFPDLNRDHELAVLMKTLQMGILAEHGYSDRKRWQQTADVLFDLGIIDEKVSVESIYTNYYL